MTIKNGNVIARAPIPELYRLVGRHQGESLATGRECDRMNTAGIARKIGDGNACSSSQSHIASPREDTEASLELSGENSTEAAWSLRTAMQSLIHPSHSCAAVSRNDKASLEPSGESLMEVII